MIDIRPVGHILGWLVLVLGFLMVPCILIDIYDGNPNAREFALTAVITIVTGAGIAVACAGAGPPDLDLRQGFLLTSGAWAIFPAVAGLPLMLGDPHLSFTDAYFELTSAMTTTGGTVIVGLDHLARGALLWRGLVNWIGGMGVILLALILLPVLNVGGMQLLRNADFATLDKVMPRAKSIALSIGAVYLALTARLRRRLRLGRHVGLRRRRPRDVDARHRRHGQLRQLLRLVRPRGALGRHGLHADRLAVLHPLRAVRPRRSRRALARQPDPHLPRDLPRLHARPPRRPRRSMATSSVPPRCARPPSTWPRSSRRPASPRPTTASGARSPRRCSSAR